LLKKNDGGQAPCLIREQHLKHAIYENLNIKKFLKSRNSHSDAKTNWKALASPGVAVQGIVAHAAQRLVVAHHAAHLVVATTCLKVRQQVVVQMARLSVGAAVKAVGPVRASHVAVVVARGHSAIDWRCGQAAGRES
jgi:hypothetical protein